MFIHPARISAKSGWKSFHSREFDLLKHLSFLQSFELGSRAVGPRCKKLTVPALLRYLRLAKVPIAGVQAIPYEGERF
ncbi:hypothetical protein [Salaquimonas pukyongi]|uniref:hypothetical protein n=1 Tax=Salaquimonas pukyongi TaxID=2712698 RepID=UPI00096BCABD|nr:hypothetical protein [Salaquimonas pukyongi]